MFWIEIKEAQAVGYCKECNQLPVLKYHQRPCNYHQGQASNYRDVPDGMCALKPFERERRKVEFNL